MRPTEHCFDSRDALARNLADAVAALLRQGCARRGQAALAVPGGTTPAQFLAYLGQVTLAWSRIWITLTDERWVSACDQHSNQRLLRSTLLRGPGGQARFVPFVTDAVDVDNAQQSSEQALQAVPMPLDAVVLGMGEDGHVASLFPATKQLGQLLTPINGTRCGTVYLPGNGGPRLSLTLPALLNCRQIFLLIAGDSKWTVYQRAQVTGPVEAMPVRAVLRQSGVPVAVYWAN